MDISGHEYMFVQSGYEGFGNLAINIHNNNSNFMGKHPDSVSKKQNK